MNRRLIAAATLLFAARTAVAADLPPVANHDDNRWPAQLANDWYRK